MKDGELVDVKAAPSPTDLMWDNLNISTKVKLSMRFFSFLVVFGLMILTIFAFSSLVLVDEELEEHEAS